MRALFESLEVRTLMAVSIRFDYTYDTSNFFQDAATRDVLEQAASDVAGRLQDSLSAITPGGANTWTAEMWNPATMTDLDVTDLAIAEDEIVMFVGAMDHVGTVLGLGGYAGWNGSGDQAFLDAVGSRSQPGAAGSPPTDFAPAVGIISIDSGTDWHIGTTTIGLGSGEYDLYSVIVHELGHVLGISTSPAWDALSTPQGFIGLKSLDEYDLGSTAVPLTLDGHWGEGVLEGIQEAAMDPTIEDGIRKSFTRLDFAGLDDIGWSVSNGPASVVPIYMEVSDRIAKESRKYTNFGWITLTRFGDIGDSLTVEYVLLGTAANGKDYTLLRGEVVFNPGDDTTSIVVRPRNDKKPEGREKVQIKLVAGDGYTLPFSSVGEIVVKDDDRPDVPQRLWWWWSRTSIFSSKGSGGMSADTAEELVT